MGRGRGRAGARACAVVALAPGRRRLRRRRTSQRTAPAAADPGQRHGHAEGDHGAAVADRASAPNRASRSRRTSTPASRRSRLASPARRRLRHRQPDRLRLQAGDPRPARTSTPAPLVANGNGTLQTALPTGVYTVSAADIPSAKPAKLRRRPLPRLLRERRPAALAGAIAAFRAAPQRLAGSSPSLGRDRRPRHRRRRCSPRRSSTLVSRAREEPGAARPRAGDPGGDLEGAACRRPAAGQRGVAQGRRQDRRGRARQAPGGDQGAGRADRQGPGEDRKRGPTQRGETDLQTRTLLEQMGQTIGNLNSETGRPEEGAAPAADPRPVGRAAAAPLRRDRRDDRARRLRAAGDAARPKTAACGPTPRFLLPEGRSFVADSKVPLDAFLDAQEAEVESRAPGPPRAPRPAGPRARPRAQLEGLPGPVQGRRDARPGDLLHPQRARPARRLRRRPRALRLRARAQCPAGQPDLADRAAADDGARLAPGADGRRGGRDRRRRRDPARPLRQVPQRLRQGRQAARLGDQAYDSAVGSMEGRLLPQLRKVEGLGVAPGKEIEPPEAGRDHGRARSPRRSCARPTPRSADRRSASD